MAAIDPTRVRSRVRRSRHKTPHSKNSAFVMLAVNSPRKSSSNARRTSNERNEVDSVDNALNQGKLRKSRYADYYASSSICDSHSCQVLTVGIRHRLPRPIKHQGRCYTPYHRLHRRGTTCECVFTCLFIFTKSDRCTTDSNSVESSSAVNLCFKR